VTEIERVELQVRGRNLGLSHDSIKAILKREADAKRALEALESEARMLQGKGMLAHADREARLYRN